MTAASVGGVAGAAGGAVSGFTKRGDGVRYFDGRGNSWQLNKGYSNPTDNIHGGPYIKATIGEGKVRIPLKGND